ncbi:MBL fold metallo-hydrolase [Desulfonema ishimotonii]|uniref:MBL fold metallo-hydrolase n=1 Tax=Desulfonema ishimotonii TaxID=45657 RepID=A0A401G0T4_9BACT|nr:MBL fold metallo-hydrolase [Desulfonema ishimotonii]GBC62830.1 MBL fold metallo-hydrolase [Desulfonema ishimotonii]
MYIRCWGSRGSVPVSGADFVKYGGDTTCLEIRSDCGDLIIVDAGTGIRRLGNLLNSGTRTDITLILTHFHWDHIVGFPFFKPVYSPETRLRICRCPDSGFVGKIFSEIMHPPCFPVRYTDLPAQITYAENIDWEKAFSVGSIQAEAIRLSHPNTGSGYKFTENGRSFVFLTDNELRYRHPGGMRYEDYVAFASGADLLIHDAEYTPEEYGPVVGWGHSTWVDTLELALDAGARRLGLFHLNQDRTDRQVDEIVKTCRQVIAARGSDLECFAVGCDMEFTV